ncbi:MAG: DNA polymerase III subunit delta' [Chloroflexi bacterium]|nr:DNA polymerase III subunit delta' [Chloroflexota bacterium]
MPHWSILGQEHITSHLGNSIAQGRLSHAYLIAGPPLSGKTTLALDIARALNCTGADPPCGGCVQCRRITLGRHADVQVVTLSPDPRTGRMRNAIAIEQVREMEQRAALGPFEGKSLAFVIDPADKLNAESANALLKTLEEPPPRVTLLLLTSLEQEVLPTIRSRCQALELKPLGQEVIAQALTREHNVAPEDAALLAKLSGGKLGWALAAAKDPKVLEGRQERLEVLLEVLGSGLERRFQVAQEMAAQFGRNRPPVLEALALWLSWWRDLLLVRAGAPQLAANADWQASIAERAARYSAEEARAVAREVLATMERLEANVNARLALDALMLAMPRKK